MRPSVFLAVWVALGLPLQAQLIQPKPNASEVFKLASPAVVTISTASGFGSGVVIDASGLIVTNLHVVEGSASASVQLSNGDTYDDVAVVDFDARKDLLLLKVKGFKLPAVELADSDALSVGNSVFAIGAPKGLELTMSEGIVSGLRDSGEGYRVIQTSAAISPGSSGGGLFDDRGRLVGITSFKIKGGENLNFALPINYVRGMLSTTVSFSLEQLAGKLQKVAPREAVATRASSPSELLAPTLSKGYVGGVNLVLIEQDGPRLWLTFSNADGQVFARSQLVWEQQRKAFVGAGTINTVCGVYDTRIWPAPAKQELYVFSPTMVRINTENPVRVNCSRQMVTQAAWAETLWYVPSK